MAYTKADKTSNKRKRASGSRSRARTVRRRLFAPSKTDAISTRQKLSVSRGIFGFPDEFTTRLRYCDVYTLTSSSNAIAKQYMRMNSLFDPDQTGTGHQPYYFDQLAALYGRYHVLGSKMTAEFSLLPSAIATAQPSGPVLIGVVGDDSASTTTTVSTMLESSSCKHALLNSANGGPNVKVLTLTYAPYRELGLSSDDDTVGSDVAGNPAKQWYGLAWIAETGLSSASSCTVKIQVEYYVKFSQLKDISGS